MRGKKNFFRYIFVQLLLLSFVAGFTQNATSLADCIRANDTRKITKALKSNGGINKADPEGDTPLMLAALYGNAETMRWMLKKGADPNGKNSEDETALMWAIHDLEKIKILLEHEADINARTKSGNTALLLAAVGSSQFETVSFLLQNGADPLVKNKRNETPLIRAAIFGDTATLGLLIRNGNDINEIDSNGFTPLLHTLFNVNRAATIYLLENGADAEKVVAFGLTAIIAVVTYNDLPSVLAVLKATKNINAVDEGGMNALMWAVYNEHDNTAIIKALLDRGVDIHVKDKKGLTALDWARKKGNTKTVAMLLEAGAR